MEKLDKVLGKRNKPERDLAENEEIYHFKDGLRFVNPYYHEFSCFSKRRWIGHLLVDIYAQEFKAYTKPYYVEAIEHWKCDKEPQGKITVNEKNVDVKYTIKDGDRILHRTRREETPVYDSVPEIIRETKEYLIVNKPSYFWQK